MKKSMVNLRYKIKSHYNGPQFIQTVYGMGYKFANEYLEKNGAAFINSFKKGDSEKL